MAHIVIRPYTGYIISIMHAPDFTVAEASWVTGLSVKAVNKAIEDAAVPIRIVRAGGVRRRYVPYASLLCLQLHAEGLKRLPLPIADSRDGGVCVHLRVYPSTAWPAAD